MIFKQTLLKRAQISLQMLNNDIRNIRSMFEKEIELGLPHPWDGNGEVLSEEEFKQRITQKRNETPSTRQLECVILGEYVIENIKPQFQMWMTFKRLFKDLDPVSYTNNIDVELSLDVIKAHIITIANDYKIVAMYSKLLCT